MGPSSGAASPRWSPRSAAAASATARRSAGPVSRGSMQGPQSEALVEVPRILDRLPFADQPQRRPQAERSAFEVQGTPPAERRIRIGMVPGERGGEEIGRSAAPEVPERRAHLSILQVDETVPAQDQVDPREVVACDVERDEPASICSMALLIGRREFLDDLDSEIAVQLELHGAEPVEVAAAGIQHGADAELPEQRRQLAADRGGAV